VTDCQACHGSRHPEPLGFNALQLSTDRDPQAIHGEPLERGMLTLATLHDERRLAPARPELVTDPPRIRASSAMSRAVLGYLAANCGGCHNGQGEIAALGPSLKHSDVAMDGDAVVRRMVGHPTAWQVPGLPEGTSVLVDPEAPDRSALLVRMRSRRPSSQMPPLGTVLGDREAVDAISRWIERETGGVADRHAAK
jgi:mono/diheme cytochrome c family protein